jgi:O-antigen/teichoic acid export membrane protein
MNAWGLRLSHAARNTVLLGSLIVIVSGIAWMILGLLVDGLDYADPLHTWRHRALVLHGVAAYLLLWIMGRLSNLHQQGNWRAHRNRMNGLMLSMALGMLAISGLCLYYPPQEDWHTAISLLHQALGIALVLLLPLHLLSARALRRVRNRPDNAR